MAETRRGALLRLKNAVKNNSPEGLTHSDILKAAEVALAAHMFCRHSHSVRYWRVLNEKEHVLRISEP